MAKNVFYRGAFYSRHDHIIKVEILKEGTPASVGALSFPAESPLTIEWSAEDKQTTLQGSTATLTIISPADRTYLDLYTAEVGSVRLDVYRDNALYWSGTLDTEFYEEPFTSNKDYDVTLTFEDFGIWERLKYNLTGLATLQSILDNALERAATAYTSAAFVKYVSTKLNATSSADLLSSLSIYSDNFTDEDGETSSLSDVIEGILQPLGLHIRQYAGKVYIYDHNALLSLSKEVVNWESDDATLAVDEVANSVTITFSPYANATVFGDEYFSYNGVTSVDDFSSEAQGFLTDVGGFASDGGATHAWYPNYGDRTSGQSSQDYQNLSFGLYTKNNAALKGLEYLNTSVMQAYFLPLLGGSERHAILQGYYYSGHTHATSENKNFHGQWKAGVKSDNISQFKLFTAAQGNVTPDKTNKVKIKVLLELLYDTRYNPEESAGEENEQGYTDQFTKQSSTVYVPVRIYVRGSDGSILCHYKNADRCKSSEVDLYFNRDTFTSNTDGWVLGAPIGTTAANWECWLNWYKLDDDRAEKGGLDGWTKNGHAVGFKSQGKFAESYKERNEGEILPCPPLAGQLVIEVYRGVYVYDYKVNLNWGQESTLSNEWLSDKIRWHAYAAPVVTLINNDLLFEDIEADDIEEKGELLATAQDDISIDTICGTAKNTIAGARGVYRDADGDQITSLYRAGRTTTAEQLLIGTYISHYASRHAVLTGTIRLSNASGLHLYKDSILNLPMVATAESVNLGDDENEVTLIETNIDNYEND